ncbi:MAG: hypothetical protein KAY37_02200 [Phycisphaerae bacterium]|nr:hypothetical protein [Phycisphaerae bacterium]
MKRGKPIRTGIRVGLEIAAERLRAAGEHTGQLVILLRTRGRLWPLAAAGAVLVVILLAVGLTWSWRSAGQAHGTADSEQAWRYLIVCEQCGYRQRTSEHPVHTLEQRAGRLRCPECNRFKAAWFRRGSLAMPPGGWSTSRPATGTAVEAGEDGQRP